MASVCALALGGPLSGVADAKPPAPKAHVAAAQTRDRLAGLLASGAIDQPAYDRTAAAYDGAVKALATLKGDRLRELKAVVATFDGIAARGQLSAGRLPALVLTLEANLRWWTTQPLLRVGQRVSVPGSTLVWQHYAGLGIQIQWLATFGRANALWEYKKKDPELRALLDEAIELATPRAGGIAWEYLFAFDGGKPPWVSGLAQGTALTALARAAVRLNDPRYFAAGRSALGIFTVAPPEGVLEQTPVGAHFLQYSFAPGLHILNGFVQSLNGLSDFARLANDDGARFLLMGGSNEALAELPAFDTGGWSRYSNEGRDSDLGYHKVLRDFLRGLCSRGGDQAFCAFADRLTADLTTPPVLRIATPAKPPRQRLKAALRFTLDKPARVTVSITGPRAYSYSASASFASGDRAFAWRPPRAGPYVVRLQGRDLAGNVAAVDAPLSVRR